MSVVVETTDEDARGRRLFKCTVCNWADISIVEANRHARKCKRSVLRGPRADRVWDDEEYMGQMAEDRKAVVQVEEVPVRTRRRSSGALR